MEFGWPTKERRFRHELRAVMAAEVLDRWSALIPGEEFATEFAFEFCRTARVLAGEAAGR